MCLANDFHHSLRLSIFARTVLDVSETYKVCKIRRTFWDVPIIPRCEGPDRSSGMPRLVVPRLFEAVGPQSTESKRVVFVCIIEKVFKLGGQTWAFTPSRKQTLQETLELLVFLGSHSDYGDGKAMIRYQR
jgi:hypothetical protein